MNTEKSFRGEIQGLRAVAVLLVLVFHIWPDVLPGGYVGVDVFFVISGYLITGLLVRAALRDGRISLLDFYSRRARRLLPAATLALMFSVIGTFAFLPQARWIDTAIQIAASALYIQNWALALLAVDYLGAENAASPVQHYWSLSIEEQFYFIWPMVMIAALYLAPRIGLSLRKIFLIALAAIFVLSLAASIRITAVDQGWAYFVTHTRMWELALGGLLALTTSRIPAFTFPVRIALVLGGLSAIVWSALTYSATTPFPGWMALVPTLGTVAVIVAGNVRKGLFSGLDTKLLRYIGDRSYSIYLWHWPLVVFYTVGRDAIGWVDGVLLLALTFALSHLSYRFVEERFRHPSKVGELRPLAYALASILGFVALAGFVQFQLRSPGGNDDVQGAIALQNPYYDWQQESLVTIQPPLAAVADDLPSAYGQGCIQNHAGTEVIECSYGEDGIGPKIAIIGDSHAVNWLPALEALGERGTVHAIGITKTSCAFSLQAVYSRRTDGPYEECVTWSNNVIEWLARERPDLTLIAHSSGHRVVESDGSPNGEQLAGQFVTAIEAVLALNLRVALMQSTPWLAMPPAECLEIHSDWQRQCATPANIALRYDPMMEAARRSGVPLVETSGWVCRDGLCPPVIGGSIVYRDRHHFTQTFGQSLAPLLWGSLSSIITSPSP